MTNVVRTKHVWKLALPLMIAWATFLGGPTSARATTALAVNGTLSTHIVSCSTLCTSGTISGTLSGTFDYTMSTMTATSNGNIFFLEGTFVIVTSTGTLTATDKTVWNVSTGQFNDIAFITGGTGAYAGATGVMDIVGTFDIAAGTGQSQYAGVVVLP